jgi:hypothetical protein
MTAPQGPLTWGQSNSYNAQDDRAVISALSNNTAGLIKAPTFSASGGLTMAIGAFMAIVACGDGTSILANNTFSRTVTLAAGPASGSRTDIIWLDIDPDFSGVWTINVLTQAATVGRLGIKLGQVVMPQGANTAAAGTMTPSPVSYKPFGAATVPVNVSLYRSSQINMISANYINIGGTGLGWQSEDLGSPVSLWTAAGFVAPVAGTYLLGGRCSWVSNASGYRAATAIKNGSQLITSQSVVAPSPVGAVSGSFLSAYPVKCVAGDVLSMGVYQSSGGNLVMTWAQFSVSQQS